MMRAHTSNRKPLGLETPQDRSLLSFGSRKRRTPRPTRRPCLEALEERWAPATLEWLGNLDEDWSTRIVVNGAAFTNWSGNDLPQNGDTLVFDDSAGNDLDSNNDLDGLSVAALIFNKSGFDLSGNQLKIGAGGITFDNPGIFSGQVTINFDIRLAADQTWTVTGSSGGLFAAALEINGVVSGSSDLDIDIGGFRTTSTIVLNENNTLTGTITVGPGAHLVVAADGALGANTIVNGGGRLTFRNVLYTTPENVELSGGSLIGDNALFVGPVTLTAASTIRSEAVFPLTGNIANGGCLLTYDAEANTAGTISSVISGGGGLTKIGAGTLTMVGSPANTYTGVTTVTEGTLVLDRTNNVNAIPGPLAIAATVQLDSNGQIADSARVTINGGRLDLQGHSETIGSLAGTGTVDLEGPTFNGLLTLGGDDTSTVFSGLLTGSPANGGLSKTGTGTFTLAGNNTYGAPTAVAEGTLLVNGAQPNSPIQVLAGATLGGTGETGPVTVAASATLSPGNGPGAGILSVGNLTLGPGQFSVGLNGASVGSQYDRLNVNGAVDVSGATLELNFGFTPAVSERFLIISNDGADPTIGVFAGWPEGATRLVNGNLYRISYQGNDGNDVTLTRTTNVLVTAVDAGNQPRVRVFDLATQAERFNFLAYAPTFKGGVRIASADANGDEFPDIITAPGPGTKAIVKVFSGATAPGQAPQLLYQFKPYGNFKGGAFVAAGGDVNGDGVPDIITGPGAGMASTVRIFSGVNGAPLGSFSAFAGFKGGVTVAAGDVNGDQVLDIVTGMGAGNKPRVRIFDSASRTQLAGPMGNFLAYGAKFTGGVFVAAGDVNGDTYADVIVGPGAGSAPLVKVFTKDEPAAPRAFLAFPAARKKGIRVAAGDVNGDAIAEIITALGPDGGAEVRVFDLTLAVIDRFFAEAASFKKGLFIAS